MKIGCVNLFGSRRASLWRAAWGNGFDTYFNVIIRKNTRSDPLSFRRSSPPGIACRCIRLLIASPNVITRYSITVYNILFCYVIRVLSMYITQYQRKLNSVILPIVQSVWIARAFRRSSR